LGWKPTVVSQHFNVVENEQRVLNLHDAEIPNRDGPTQAIKHMHDPSITSGNTSVIFRDHARVLKEEIMRSQLVLGCVAWFTQEDILTALHEARDLTLSSKDATAYGVHFQTDKAVRFTGGTYDAGAASNVTYLFDPRVLEVSISLSGAGSDVTFKRLTGEANATGTVVVAVYGQVALRSTTTVSQSGIIQ
jgi:hypothetical protein